MNSLYKRAQGDGSADPNFATVFSPPPLQFELDEENLAVRMNGKVLFTANTKDALALAWADRYFLIGLLKASRRFSHKEKRIARALSNPTKHSFATGFAEGLAGDVRPIGELWDGIEAE